MKCQAMTYLGLGEERPCENEAVAGKCYCKECLEYEYENDSMVRGCGKTENIQTLDNLEVAG